MVSDWGTVYCVDGKRLSVRSVLRFNVTKVHDNTSVICQTKDTINIC